MSDKDIKTIVKSVPIILAVILYLIFSNTGEESKPATIDSSDIEVTTVTNSTSTITPDEAEKKTGNQLQQVSYVKINDGDTFTVNVNGKDERVRLLMVDTPEMNYDKGEPMYYAEEAKAFTEKLLKNANKIELLADKGPERDDYERLLAYIFIDGKLLQEALLENGFATMRYVNKPNNTLEQELRAVQKTAEQKKLNVWSIEGYVENNRFQSNK